MTPLTNCPDPVEFRSMLLGLSDDAEAAPLEDHLANCGPCQTVVRDISLDDELIRALRAYPTHTPIERQRLDELIGRLQSLRSSDVTAADGRDDCTVNPRVEPRVYLRPPVEEGELGQLGPYRVLGVLGSGGMGVVYRAYDPALDRVVALKVLPNPWARERFLREGKAMARVRHAGVAHVYQTGEDNGVCWIAMELLEGESLDRVVAREGKLPPDEVARIGREAAEALAAAHALGIVHRDIKPANLWREPSGRIKVLDFGLARAAEKGRELTHEGAIIGTPAYMAPEQARGERVDERADLFSLGCVLYRLATGKEAFSGKDAVTTLLAVSTQEVKPASKINAQVPRELSALIDRMLAKTPTARPASAAEVARELAGERPARPVRTGGWRRVALGLGLAAALAATLAVIRLETPDGTLVLDTADDAVEVVVRQGGREVAVLDTKTKSEYRVRPGKYDFELRDEKNQTTLEAKEVTVTSGERRVVRVTFVPRAKVEEPAKVIPKENGSVLDRLDPMKIPSEERAAWQPKELRAVLGSRRQRHWGDVRSIAQHPEGKWIASTAGLDNRLCFWDPRDLRLLREVTLQGWNMGVAASPDGKMLAVVRDDPTSLLIYDVSGEEPVLKHSIPLKSIHGLPPVWHPGGKLVAVSILNSLIVVDPTGPEPKTILTAKAEYAGDVAITGDGQILIWRQGSNSVLLWDISGPEPRELPTIALEQYVHGYRIVASPTGRLVAIWKDRSNPPDLRLIDLATPERKVTPVPINRGIAALTFTSDGKTLVAGGRGWFGLWDLDGAEVKQRLSHATPESRDSMVYSAVLAVAKDGKRLFSGGNHGQVRAFDITDDKVIEQPAWRGVGWHTQSVSFSQDGNRLLVRTGGDFARVWELTQNIPRLVSLVPTDNDLERALFSPVGDRMVTYTQPRVRLWDVTKEKATTLAALEDRSLPPIHRACYSPDGKRLALRMRGQVLLCDLTGDAIKPLGSLAMPDSNSWLIAFSPDGKTLAVTGTNDVTLLDVTGDTPKFLRQIPVKDTMEFRAVSFSPDGTLLAVMGLGLSLIDLELPEPQTRIRFVDAGIGWNYTAMSFTPDGKTLVTAGGGWPLTVRFYEVPTREDAAERAVLKQRPKAWMEWKFPGHVRSLAVSPCGKYVVTGNNDGTAYVLAMPERPK